MTRVSLVGPEPDVVLYAPTEELRSEGPRLQQRNAYEPRGEGRSRRPHTLEHPALDVYNGFDSMLVRTALIRSRDYDPDDHPVIASTADAANLCRHLSHATSEFLVTLSISAELRLLAIHEAGLGSEHQAAFTIRQVLQVAFLTAASNMIMVHNHPSGNPSPSSDDFGATAAVARGAACAGVHLVDSIIVAERGYFSFTDRGAELKNIDDVVGRRHLFRYERWSS